MKNRGYSFAKRKDNQPEGKTWLTPEWKTEAWDYIQFLEKRIKERNEELAQQYDEIVRLNRCLFRKSKSLSKIKEVLKQKAFNNALKDFDFQTDTIIGQMKRFFTK